MKFKFFTLIFFAFFLTNSSFSQNLIINPSAESPLSAGWTIVSKGTDCYTGSNWRIMGNQNGYPVAHQGSYFFFSGCNSVNGELYQDIDVTGLAADIDAGNRNFTFTGYMQVYDQTPADKSQIIVEYRNAANQLLVSYNTGLTENRGIWTTYTSTLTAPFGTRKVRIRLLSYAGNGSSVDAYFDDLSLTSVKILPLELVSFITTTNDENEVIATWKTANEINTDRFELERSANGMLWEPVATVGAAGNSSTLKSYSTADRFPLPGQSFYRLVQYDKDGKFSVSKVNTVKINGTSRKVQVYPNPAVSKITIQGSASSLNNLNIFNSTGQNVLPKTKLIKQNATTIHADISQLPAGIYFIRSNGGSTTFYKK